MPTNAGNETSSDRGYKWTSTARRRPKEFRRLVRYPKARAARLAGQGDEVVGPFRKQSASPSSILPYRMVNRVGMRGYTCRSEHTCIRLLCTVTTCRTT